VDALNRALACVLVLCAGTHGSARSDDPALTPCAQRPAFAPMRYEENWTTLADHPCRAHWLDPLKHIDLGRQRHLTLGGDARIRYEYFRNPGFGAGVQDPDGYLLQRYLLHGDLHLHPRLRVFAQLESSLLSGREGGARRTDRNRIDLNQAFVEWSPWRSGEDVASIRLGRQEVELGSAQFTSARDGLNDRLSFDGIRLVGQVSGWRFHAMATEVVQTEPGSFDDPSRRDETLSGFFLSRRQSLLPAGNAVAYASRRTRPETLYFDGQGKEARITAGTRWWGRGRNWDYNLEAGVQRGDHGADDIRVWYVNTDNGWNFDARWEPRLGVRFSIGSGDRASGDGELNTFSPLFASTAYSGLSGLIGPSNSVNVAPSLRLRPHPELSVLIGTSVFWRQSRDDGIYNIASELLRPPGASGAYHVGTQPTLQVTWTPSPRVTLLTTLSYFRAGAFLRETPPGENVTYFTSWWAYRF
jgi:hypothetical protein